MTDTKVKFTISIPVDRPSANGCIYTKEAVKNAVCNLNKYLPIIYRDNGDEKVVGATTGNQHMVLWNEEEQVYKIVVDGVLFSSGADIMIDKIEDGKITDFRITGIGLSGEVLK